MSPPSLRARHRRLLLVLVLLLGACAGKIESMRELAPGSFTGSYGVKPWARDPALADRLWAPSETWI